MSSLYLWPDNPALSIFVLWLVSVVFLWAAREPMLQLIRGLGKNGVDATSDLSVDPLEDREKELFLAVEVLIHRALANAGPLGDVGDPGRREALLGKDEGRGLDEDLPFSGQLDGLLFHVALPLTDQSVGGKDRFDRMICQGVAGGMRKSPPIRGVRR